MALQTKTLYGIIVLLAAALVISSTFTVYYYGEYGHDQSLLNSCQSGLRSAGKACYANVLLDFNGGTCKWYNNTLVPIGWNLYTVLLNVTKGNVSATWYSQPYNEHFINAIEGVQGNATTNMYWLIWTYNYNGTTSWQMAMLGVDDLPIYNGSIFAFSYSPGTATTYTPSCK